MDARAMPVFAAEIRQVRASSEPGLYYSHDSNLLFPSR